MKKLFPAFLMLSLLMPGFARANALKNQPNATGFTENKGQISDQQNKPRRDVLFAGSSNGLVYHLKQNGISYQMSRVESWHEEKDYKTLQDQKIPSQTTIYRLDMEWIGMNAGFKMITDAALPGYTNYHSDVCPDGIYHVKSYEGVLYKELYKNIDLHYYQRDGKLKYDYLVAPHGDYKQVRIRIYGAEKISLQRNGSVNIKTPLGTLVEEAPLVLQGGKKIASRWILKNNELSFSIGKYDPALPLIIDPFVRNWGTYYGTAGFDEAKGCATDAGGNVYMAGRSNSGNTLATSGAFQNTLGGGYDAFLVKFNSSGVQQWATYYGGSGDEYGNACVTDASGNIYMAGQTSGSTSGIASGGTGHQGFNGGGWDAFIVKFNGSGVRQWGTYMGGSGTDQAEGLAINGSELYVSGYTASAPGGFPANPIATAGAHQTTYGSAFLVKFNTAGVRQWGTYYSNSSYTHGNCCAVDVSGNVYLAGNTEATGGIATTGAHQTSFLGLMDGYLAKFDNAGVRQWGTYYGDVSLETVAAVITDAAGNVYMAGSTGSPIGIATAGAHQTVIGQIYNPDAMLIKFDGAGVRQWGTYYGGGTEDYASSCVMAPNGDIYMSGYSNSTGAGVIATANGFQATISGAGDGFLARFTTAGTRVWATFYGEPGDDFGYACASDANSTIYLAGRCGPGTGTTFATSGALQGTYSGGASDGFLAQFMDCAPPAAPVNVTPASNTVMCSGTTMTLTVSGSGTINWYNSSSSTLSFGTGSVFTYPTLSAGTATFFAEASDLCGISARTPVIAVVHPEPATTISGTTAVCAGGSVTLSASGASQYLWNTGPASAVITVTPSGAAAYTVTGTSVNGCTAQANYTVTAYPQPVVNATATSTLICKGQTTTLTATGATQYTWSTGSNNATLPVSPVSNAGYTVIGYLNGCIATASVALMVAPCAGLPEQGKELQISVFPNPAHETITVQLQGAAEIRLINTLGQLLLQKKSDASVVLDLNAYAKGIYLLEIKQSGLVKVVRFVKE